jgi:hypothetical protein
VHTPDCTITPKNPTWNPTKMFRAVWGSMLGLRGVKTHNPPSFLILWRLKGRQKLKFPRQPYSFSGGTGTKTHGTQKRGVYTRNCLPISASWSIQNCSVCFQISEHAHHGHIIIFTGVETMNVIIFPIVNVWVSSQPGCLRSSTSQEGFAMAWTYV